MFAAICAVPVLLILSIVLAPTSAAPDLISQARLGSNWLVPDQLRRELVCNLFCIKNTTSAHEALARAIKTRRSERGEKIEGSWEVFVEDTCIEKCNMDVTNGKKSLGQQFTNSAELPQQITDYVSCATGCRQDLTRLASGKVPTPDEAAGILRRCGVVHVQASDADFVTEVRNRYEDMRKGRYGPSIDKLMDLKNPPLRSGREEIWVPYEQPFSRFTEILADPVLAEVVSTFFNHSTVVVDHVNVINAPGGSVTERQSLHSDIGIPGKHLEIHLGLATGGLAPLEMGPPRFCPCTNNRVDLRDPHERTIRRYFGGNQFCTQNEELNWVLHKGVAVRNSNPWVVIYDADVYHQGLENVSPRDRPVMVIALTSTLAEVHERNYVKRNVSAEHTKALIDYRGVDLSKVLSHPELAAEDLMGPGVERNV